VTHCIGVDGTLSTADLEVAAAGSTVDLTASAALWVALEASVLLEHVSSVRERRGWTYLYIVTRASVSGGWFLKLGIDCGLLSCWDGQMGVNAR
jgi:hypothetical protein